MVIYRALAEAIGAFEKGRRAAAHSEDRMAAADYLAALAPLLARAALGEDILGEIAGVERLFSQGRIVDQAAFEDAFRSWRCFRDEYERAALGGMTVNERLAAVGTLDAFDRAVASRNREEVVRLLRRVHVDEPSIAKVVDAL